jgi:hypothetical protein
LLDGVASVVRSELDRIIMATDAPLVLPDTEREVLTAVLSERVDRDELPPLEGRHFGIGVWGVLWDASRETRDIQSLHLSVLEAGFPSVSPDIAEMVDYHGPLPSLADLAGMCTRVRGYWARRLLHRELVGCARLLAAEGLDCEGVFDRLRPIVREIRS